MILMPLNRALRGSTRPFNQPGLDGVAPPNGAWMAACLKAVTGVPMQNRAAWYDATKEAA